MRTRNALTLVLALGFAFTLASSAKAVDYNWEGDSGVDQFFSTVENWVGDATVVPAEDARLYFNIDSVGEMDPDNDFANDSKFGKIGFQGSAGDYTLSGNDVLLFDDDRFLHSDNAANLVTVNLNIDFSGSNTGGFGEIEGDGDIDINGILSGTQSLRLYHEGIRRLMADNTYSGGNTEVRNGGMLFVNGSILGDVNLHETASIGGSGWIGGGITANGNTSVRPGGNVATIGMLTALGNVNLTNNSHLRIDVLNDGTSDLLNVIGDLTIGGSAILDLAGTYNTDYDYDIAAYTGSLTGGSFGTVNNLDAAFTVDFSSAGVIRLVANDPLTDHTSNLAGAGAGAPGDWNTAATWLASALPSVPGATTRAIVADLDFVDVAAAATAKSLEIQGSGGVTVSADTLAIVNRIDAGATSVLTIDSAVTATGIAALGTVDLTTGASLTLSGASASSIALLNLSGGGAASIDHAGTLALGDVADGAAGFVLTKSGAGTLSIDHTSATPANFAATTIDLAAGTLQSTGALVLDGDLDVTGSGVTVKSVAGQFKIDGGTAIGDGNTLNVSGDVHLGSVTIAAGESATIVAAAASDVVEINTLAVGDGSGLTVTGPGGSYNSTGSVQIAPNSTVTFNSTAASYSGGNLQSAGADTLNFSGSQSYASLVRAGASLDLALAAGTKVTVGTYNDATQAGDVNISGAGGSFVIDTVAGGGVTAADTTVNVAAGATFEALGDQGAGGPLGSGGAVAVNLAGGTARFSLGGGTLQSPVQTLAGNGLNVHYDAHTLNLSDGAAVTAWEDLSGNDRHLGAYQGTPNYMADAGGGHPAVAFTNGENLDMDVADNYYNKEVYLVFSTAVNATWGTGDWSAPIGIKDIGDGERQWMLENNQKRFWGDGNKLPAEVSHNGDVIAIAGSYELGPRDLSEIMILKVTANPNSSQSLQDMIIGTRTDAWSNGAYNTREVVSFNTTLSDADEDNLGGYLAAKYGIDVTGTSYEGNTLVSTNEVADVSGDLNLNGTNIGVSADSTLEAITDGTATFGDLTITGNNTLSIKHATTGTVFNALAAIAAGDAVGVTSTSDVTVNTGALTLGDGASFTFTGDDATFTIPGTTVSGPTGTIAANSSISGGPLSLTGTLNVGGAGAQNYGVLSPGSAVTTINFTGTAPLTVGGYDDSGAGGPGAALNLTGAGTLTVDTIASGSIAIADTTVSVSAGATFAAAGDQGGFGPLGGSAGTINLDGGIAEFSLGGGSLSQTPEEAFGATVSAHYDAATIALGDGASVTAWEDLSGNGRDLVTYIGDPNYIADSGGGLPAVNFQSEHMRMDAADPYFPKDAFVVFRSAGGNGVNWGNNWGAPIGAVDGPDDQRGWMLRNNDQSFWEAEKPQEVVFNGNDVPDNAHFDIGNTYPGTDLRDMMILRVVMDDGQGVNLRDIGVGSRNDTWGDGYYDTAEVIIFDTELSDDDEASLGGYLADKYGIDVTGTSYEGESLGGALVSGDLDLSTTDVNVSVDSSLHGITDGTATFGDLVIADGATLTIAGAATGTVFNSLNAIAAGESAGISSTRDVTITTGLLDLGDGASFTFTGDDATFSVLGTTVAGTSSTITANSSISGGPLSLSGVLTLGGTGSQTYDTVSTTSAVSGLNIPGGTLTIGGFTDAGAGGPGAVFDVTGSAGSLTIDTIAGGSVLAGDTTIGVGTGVSLIAAGDQGGTGPLGAAGTTINLDGGSLELSLGGGTLTQTPAEAIGANLEAHYDAGTILGLNNGDTVTAWEDLSGNGRDLVPYEGNPNFVANAKNGLPAVNFQQASLQMGSVDKYLPWDTYLVFRSSNESNPTKWGPDWGAPIGPKDVGDQDRMWVLRQNDDNFWEAEKPSKVVWNGQNIPDSNHFDIGNEVGGAPSMGDMMILKVVMHAGNHGTQTRDIVVGSRTDWVNNSRFDTAEVLMFNQELSAQDEASLGGYLAEKYDIDVTGTPYEGQSLGGPNVSGDLVMTTTNFNVTNDSDLVLITDGSASFGDLSLQNGTLNLIGTHSAATFASLTAIPDSATVAITSPTDVTIPGGSLVLGDGASFTFNGGDATFTVDDTTLTGTSGGLAANSTISGGPLTVPNGNFALTIGGNGDQNYSNVLSHSTGTLTVDFTGNGTVNVQGYDDGAAATGLTVTGGGGKLVLDGTTNPLILDNTTIIVGDGATLAAHSALPLGAGQTVTLDGGTLELSLGGGTISPTLAQSGAMNARYDAATIAIGGGQQVTAWADISGNDRHLGSYQGTPVYITDAGGGFPAVSFSNGQNLDMDVADPYFNKEVYLVFSTGGAATFGTGDWSAPIGVKDIGDENRQWMLENGQKRFWSDGNHVPAAVTQNGNVIGSSPFELTGSMADMMLLKVTANPNQSQSLQDMIVGTRTDAWSNGAYQIREIVSFDRPLTAEEEAGFGNELATKYNIDVTGTSYENATFPGPQVLGDLDMSTSTLDVTGAGSGLSLITDTQTIFGGLTFTDGADLDIVAGTYNTTTFNTFQALGAGESFGVSSNHPVHVLQPLSLAAGASFSYSGGDDGTFNAPSTSLAGDGTITANSVIHGGPLTLGAGTYTVGGSGTQSFDSITTTATGITIDFINNGIVTSPDFDDQSSGARTVTVSQSAGADGRLVFTGGTIVATDTTFEVTNGARLVGQGAAPFGAGANVVLKAGGTLEASGVAFTDYSQEWMTHYGYHIRNDALVMDLTNNGGMMGGGDPTTGPSFNASAQFTVGPDNRGLDFDNDGHWAQDGAISITDNYSDLILGTVHVPIGKGGTWGFRIDQRDDVGGWWLDLNQNGIFESNGQLNSNQNEQMSWQDDGWKEFQLQEGEDYMIAFTHAEGGGGSQLRGWMRAPGISDRIIRPQGDAAQSGIWVDPQQFNGVVDMSTTNITVEADSTIVANSNVGVTFGELTLEDGILTIENGGGSAGVTFAAFGDAGFGPGVIAADAVTGFISDAPVTISGGSLVIGDRADFTLRGSPLTFGAGSIDFLDDGDGDLVAVATLRVPGGAVTWPGTFAQGVAETDIIKAGAGDLNFPNLLAGSAVNTSFTVLEGTLGLSGLTPSGGSVLPITLAGGGLQVTGLDAGSIQAISMTTTDISVTALGSSVNSISDFSAAYGGLSIAPSTSVIITGADTSFTGTVIDEAGEVIVSGPTVDLGPTTLSGLTGKATVNSGLDSPELELAAGQTFQTDGAGVVAFDSLKISAPGGAVTVDTIGDSILNARGLNDQGNASTINVTRTSGNGIFRVGDIDVGGGVHNADNTTINIETGAVFEAVDNDANPQPFGTSAVTINLNGGSAVFSIGGLDALSNIPDLEAHYDAATINVANGAAVTAWEDLSGNDRHLGSFQGTPNYKTNAVNGLPAVNFRNESLDMDVTDPYVPMDAYVVFRSDYNNNGNFGPDWGAPFGVPDADDNNRMFMFRPNQANLWDSEKPQKLVWNGQDIPDSNHFDIRGVVPGADMGEYMIIKVELSATNGFHARPVIVGSRTDAWSNAYFDTAEVVIFSTKLSDDDEKNLGGHLAQKYGIDISGTPWEGGGFAPVVSGDLDLASTSINVNVAGGKISAITTGLTTFGDLTLNDPGTGLSVTFDGGKEGSLRFNSTTVGVDPFNGQVELNVGADTATGTMDFGGFANVEIVKTGSAALILDGGTPAGLGGNISFDVQVGTLSGVASSNPFGVGTAINLLPGTNLNLTSSGAGVPVQFDNEVTSNDATITAGANGGAAVGALVLSLGNAVDADLILAGGTSNLVTTDLYTLNILGDVVGAGSNLNIAGDVAVDLTTTVDDLTIASGSLTTGGATVANNVIVAGGLNLGAALNTTTLDFQPGSSYSGAQTVTVVDSLNIDSNIDMSGATLDVSAASLTLTSGALTVDASSNPLLADKITTQGGTILGGQDITATSQLNIAGSDLDATGVTLDVSTAAVKISSGTLTTDAALNPATLQISAGPGTINQLWNFGYHINNDGLMMNLHNNAGMMGSGDPTSAPNFNNFAPFTVGPSNKGMYFQSDADWQQDGTIGIGDNYSSMIVGFLRVPAGQQGLWEFRGDVIDDAVGMWLDLDQDGVFESNGALNSNQNEQLSWQDGAYKGFNLGSPGQDELYMIAFTHREGGGGSQMRGSVRASHIGLTDRVIRPVGDAAQDGLWVTGDGGFLDLPSAPGTGVLARTGGSIADRSIDLIGGSLTVSGLGGVLDMSEVADRGELITDAATDITVTNFGHLKLHTATQDEVAVGEIDVNNLTVTDGGVFEASDASLTVNIAGSLELLGGSLININLAGPFGVVVNTDPDADAVIDLGSGTHTYFGDTVIDRGALLLGDPSGLSANSNLRLDADFDANNYVVASESEFPAVLLTKGTFDRAIGVAAGEVQFADFGGGFAAKDGPLDVNIGAGAALNWNTDLGNRDLHLGYAIANNVVDFQNDIDLNGGTQSVLVVDNPNSAIDLAVMSGELSNGVLAKYGTGTLAITNAATALTGTDIDKGAISIADGDFDHLGTIRLIGAPGLDDGGDNPLNFREDQNMPVILTTRALLDHKLHINPSAGSDIDITFVEASVGMANASAVDPLLVAIGGDVTETVADARARIIGWNTDLANGGVAGQQRAISLGSIDALGPVEILNPITQNNVNDINRMLIVVNKNPAALGADTATVTFETGIDNRTDGIRKAGPGELIFHTIDANTTPGTPVPGILEVQNQLEVEDGILRLAAGSTIRVDPTTANSDGLVVQEGAQFINDGTILHDMTGNDGWYYMRGTGEFINNGTYTFMGNHNEGFRLEQWDFTIRNFGTFNQFQTGGENRFNGPGGVNDYRRFINEAGGQVIAQHKNILISENVSIIGNGAPGNEAIFEAQESRHIRFQNNNQGVRNTANADTIFRTVGTGEILLGGRWEGLVQAKLEGDVRKRYHMYNAWESDVVFDFDLSGTDTPGVLIWTDEHMYAQNGHTVTWKSGELRNTVHNDRNFYAVGAGAQFIIADGATIHGASPDLQRLYGQTPGENTMEVQSGGTWKFSNNHRLILNNDATFYIAPGGQAISETSGNTRWQFEQQDRTILRSEGRIAAVGNNAQLYFENGRVHLMDGSVTEADGFNAKFFFRNNNYEVNIEPNAIIQGINSGWVELGGRFTGTPSFGTLIGDIRFGENLYSTQNEDLHLNPDLSNTADTANIRFSEAQWEAVDGSNFYIEKNVITYNGGDRNLRTSGTGKFIIPNGVTFDNATSSNQRHYGGTDGVVSLENHGTYLMSSNSAHLFLHDNFEYENSADGVILTPVGSNDTYIDGDGNTFFHNRGKVRSSGTNFRFLNQPMRLYSGSLVEANGPSAAVRFEMNDNALIVDSGAVVRGINGGRVELGGRMEGDWAFAVAGNTYIGEQVYTAPGLGDINLNLDTSGLDIPGEITWQDTNIFVRDGTTLHLQTDIHWNGGNDQGVHTQNTGQFVIDNGVTFTHDTSNQWRIWDDDNLTADGNVDVVNHGTFEFTENSGDIRMEQNTIFENAPDGVIRSLNNDVRIYRQNGVVRIDNQGLIEVLSEAAQRAELRFENTNDTRLTQYDPDTNTLDGGTYRVISTGTQQAELELQPFNFVGIDATNGVDIIGANTTVTLSSASTAANAQFRWFNSDGNTIETVLGTLNVHGFAEVDMASTVDGGTLGGDGTINLASPLQVINGGVLDPSVLDADSSSPGAQLTLAGDVDLDSSTMTYRYRADDHINITGDLNHDETATPGAAHTLMLVDGSGTFTTGAVVLTAATNTGDLDGLWNVVVDPAFGADQITFTGEAGQNWTDLSWSNNAINLNGGTPTAAYVGLELQLELDGATEGIENSGNLPTAISNVLIPDNSGTVVGSVGAFTIASLTIDESTGDTQFDLTGGTNLTVDGAIDINGAAATVVAASTLTADSISVDGPGFAGSASLTLSGFTILNTPEISLGNGAELNFIAGAGTTNFSVGSVTADATSSIEFDSGTQLIAATQFKGDGDFNVDGADTTLLVGSTVAPTMSVFLNGGSLTIEDSSALTGGTVTFNGGTLISTGTTVGSDVVVNPTGATVDVVGASTLTFGGAGTVFNDVLTKIGTGTLAATNGFDPSGAGTGLTVSAGSILAATDVSATNDAVISVSASSHLGGGGTLNLNNGILQTTATLSTARSIVLDDTNGGTFDVTNGITSIGGGLSGAGAITKIGAGTLDLLGVGPLTNAMNVNGGTVSTFDYQLATLGGPIAVASGATLQASGAVARAVTGTGTIEATGDLILGTFVSGFDYDGLVKIGGNNVLAVDTGSANINSVSMGAGAVPGSLTSGAILQIPNNPTFSAAEGDAGNVLISGNGNTFGAGTIRGGDVSGDTATMYGADFNPANNSVDINVLRGNWFSFGVTRNITFDAQGFSPSFQGVSSDNIGVSTEFFLGGTTPWTPQPGPLVATQVVPFSGNYSQKLVFGTTFSGQGFLNFVGTGTGTGTVINITQSDGFVADPGDTFRLIRNDGAAWGAFTVPFPGSHTSDSNLGGIIETINFNVPISDPGESWAWNSATWTTDEFLDIWVTNAGGPVNGPAIVDLTPDHNNNRTAGETVRIENTAPAAGDDAAVVSSLSFTNTGVSALQPNPVFTQSGISAGNIAPEGGFQEGTFDYASGLLNGLPVEADFAFDVTGDTGNDESGNGRVFHLSGIVEGNQGTQSALVPDQGDYAGLSGTSGDGGELGTIATLLGGSNLNSADETVTMSWRDRQVGFELDFLLSDILDLTGIDGDLFVLEMTYDDSLMYGGTEEENAAAGDLYIAWLDNGNWVHAGNDSLAVVLGEWDDEGASTLTLGAWGVDTVANTLWVVTDHNSEFAAIPEPGTLVLLSLGLFGMLLGRRRRRRA